MVPSEVSDKAPVLVVAHTGERHVPRSRDVWYIQVQGHAVQSRSLQLRQGIRIPQSHRVVGTLGLSIRPGVDHNNEASVCPHPHAALLQPEDRSAHAVDVVHLLMDISGQLDAGADKDRAGGRVPRPLLRCIEVGRVGIRIAGQDRQGRLVRKESRHRQVVHCSSRRLGDGDKDRVRVLHEDGPNIIIRRRRSGCLVPLAILATGCAMPTENIGELLLRRLGSTEELQLPTQSGAPAAPHSAELKLADRAPERTVPGLRGLNSLELGEVTDEDEGGLVAGGLPDAEQALEYGRGDLADLIEYHKVVRRHAQQRLVLRPVASRGP